MGTDSPESEVVEASTKYRTNPLLLVYPARIANGRQLIAEISSSLPPLLVRDSRFVWAISGLPEEYTQSDAYALWAAEPRVFEERSSIWTLAIETGVVVPLSATGDTIRRYDAWHGRNWDEAALYNEATRDYPFVPMDQPGAVAVDTRRMAEYRREADPPCVYQTFPACDSTRLARLDPNQRISTQIDVLSSDSRRSLPGLGLFFDICFGERGKLEWGVQGTFLHKSIPSGGARHPTEVFLVAFRVPELAPGVYHYNVQHHRLDCIAPGDYELQVKNATYDLFLRCETPPIACLVFTSLYERAMWRYREARSWRAVLIDVGHALAAYRRVAEHLGFRCSALQKFDDSAISQLLNLDARRQTPLFIGSLV
jgi:SagB-type dehydrogenase family enzyme